MKILIIELDNDLNFWGKPAEEKKVEFTDDLIGKVIITFGEITKVDAKRN